MRKEMDMGDDGGPYRAPARLRMRSDFSSKPGDNNTTVFEANE